MCGFPTELWTDILRMSCDPSVPVVLNIAHGTISSADPLLAIPLVCHRWRDIASSLHIQPFKLHITDSIDPCQELAGFPSVDSTARTMERWLAKFQGKPLVVACRFAVDNGSMYRPQLCVVQSLFSHRNQWDDMDPDIRPFIKDEIGDFLEDGLPQLRRLSLRYPPVHDYRSAELPALDKCPLLQDVTLIKMHPDIWAFRIPFENLTSLSLFEELSTEAIDLLGLWAGLSVAHNLQSLTIGVHRRYIWGEPVGVHFPNIDLPHLRNLQITSVSTNFFHFTFGHLVAPKLSALTIISRIDSTPTNRTQGLGIMAWGSDITRLFRQFLSRSPSLREFHFNFDTRSPDLYSILSLLPDLTSLSWPLPPTASCSSLHLRFDDAGGKRRLVSGSCPKLESITFYPQPDGHVAMPAHVLDDWFSMIESRWRVPEDGVNVARLRVLKAHFLAHDPSQAVHERLWRLQDEGLRFINSLLD